MSQKIQKGGLPLASNQTEWLSLMPLPKAALPFGRMAGCWSRRREMVNLIVTERAS